MQEAWLTLAESKWHFPKGMHGKRSVFQEFLDPGYCKVFVFLFFFFNVALFSF